MVPHPSIGAFYHPHLAPEILDAADLIDHLAMADSPDPLDANWPSIRSRFTLLLHDYLGELSDPLEPHELERARALLGQYRSPWAAEHLQRLRCSQNGSGKPKPRLDYVFPPLYTEDLLADFATHIKALREHLGVPLAIEPIPTYLRLDIPQMSEPEFLDRLCRESGCHLLLDVPHAVLSARACGWDPAVFLQALPLDRVIEMHVAGCADDPDLQEPWIAPVPPDEEMLELAVMAASRAPELRAITFDAYSPHLTADTLLAGVRLLRERFA
jgi:uncharacterized protein (UPF0276 family)